MFKSDDELIREFRGILYNDKLGDVSGPKGNENAIQAFMEKHSRLIPTPDVLSGGLLCNVIISKLPISLRAITDYVYVSISSGEVKITLVELENSKRKIFQKNNPEKFHSDFTSALHQVEKWQMYLSGGENRVRLLNMLKNLLPEGFPEVAPQIDYMLIISGALPSGPTYKAVLNQFSLHRSIKILTYEDVIAALPYSVGEKNILSKSVDGYTVNNLSEKHAQLLSNCAPSILRIDGNVLKKMRLPEEAKEQVAHWQNGGGRKGDPWRVQIMGRHGFALDMGRANYLMDVFRRAMNCCEWPECHNQIFQGFKIFNGSFVHHRYEVNENGFWGETRTYKKSDVRLYCDVHYKKVPLMHGRVSEMMPYPLKGADRGKSFEIDALARRAVLSFIVQHCLPGNLQGVGIATTLREVSVYRYITNWLMTVASMSAFRRAIYLPLIYMADILNQPCSVNPYMLVGRYFYEGFSPARYSPAFIKDERLIRSVEHEESTSEARWTLSTQDENGVWMNEVISLIRQRFTLEQLVSMFDSFDFKPFEDATTPVVVDLLPLWLEE